MTVKGVLTGHSEHAILEETARGEDLSLRTYQEALNKNLPVAIRSIIEQQFEQVRQARAHIVTLRDATSPQEPTSEEPTPPQPTRVS